MQLRDNPGNWKNDIIFFLNAKNKIMRPLIYPYFLIFTSIVLMVSCEKENEDSFYEDVFNVVTIEPIADDNPSFFAKTIILYEDNDYLIKTNLETYINSYPFNILNHAYDEIKMQITEDSNNQDTLLMTDYLSHHRDSTYILATHLENGSCLIFDKKKNKIVLLIKMGEWGGSPAPLAGAGGRKFFINNKLFLQTTDWIS